MVSSPDFDLGLSLVSFSSTLAVTNIFQPMFQLKHILDIRFCNVLSFIVKLQVRFSVENTVCHKLLGLLCNPPQLCKSIVSQLILRPINPALANNILGCVLAQCGSGSSRECGSPLSLGHSGPAHPADTKQPSLQEADTGQKTSKSRSDNLNLP